MKAKHLKENQCLVTPVGARCQTDIDWKGFFFQIILLSAVVLVCAVTFEPLKMAGICVKNGYNSETVTAIFLLFLN